MFVSSTFPPLPRGRSSTLHMQDRERDLRSPRLSAPVYWLCCLCICSFKSLTWVFRAAINRDYDGEPVRPFRRYCQISFLSALGFVDHALGSSSTSPSLSSVYTSTSQTSPISVVLRILLEAPRVSSSLLIPLSTEAKRSSARASWASSGWPRRTYIYRTLFATTWRLFGQHT